MPLSSHEFFLWFLFAALTAATIAYILRAVFLGHTAHGAREAGIAVYRDQLEELDRDVEKGILPETEAASARIEISRRLLAAADADPQESSISPLRQNRAIGLGIAAALPLFVLGLYLTMGSPGLSGQPYAERLAQPLAQLPVEGLVARLEQRLKEEPDDAQGWRLIAPVYLQLGRYGDAITAFGTIMQLEGRDADALAGIGEALTLSENGLVPEPARQAFEAALRENPTHPRARYYRALSIAQTDDLSDALEEWQALLADAPEGAPWAAAVEAQIRTAEQILAEREARLSAESEARRAAEREAPLSADE